MSRPIKDLILNEGFTDLGTLQIQVTEFEFPVLREQEVNENAPQQSWSVLFQTKFTNGAPIPAGYKYEFDAGIFQRTLISNKEGFVDLQYPELPIVKITEGDLLAQIKVNGPLESRNQECYLRITDGVNAFFTLITDIISHAGYLSIFDGDETYYTLSDSLKIFSTYTALTVTKDATLTAYNTSGVPGWVSVGQMTFWHIEFPEELTVISDGIYATNTNTGSVTSGFLGASSTPFENFWATIENPVPYITGVNIKIYEPFGDTLIFDSNRNVLPGSKDFVVLTVDGPPAQVDSSPNLSAIETISGVTFTTELTTFLTGADLETLNALKSAGPIKFLDGLPTVGVTEAELKLLQGHVDLYTINEDITVNQHLIATGYDNLYAIANTSKKQFLDAVVAVALPLFKAAQIHEVVGQTQKMISNALAERISDFKLNTPVFPVIPGNNFVEEEFAGFINSCDCDDCASAVSPFTYMVDLLMYGGKHVSKTEEYTPVNYSAFVTLLQDYFYQPFGTLAVDCHTLHEQYCRVRLVTEVLEKFAVEQSLPTPVLDQLEADRLKFLQLTYQNILLQASTSFEELRDVVKMQPLEDKVERAERWANKLGIPLYVPEETELTADRIWLTVDNADPDNELTAENLELIFGFRDTLRDVLTTTPESLMEEWRAVHLRDLWRKADYPFTNYSREHVDPTDNGTFKDNWLPIIDPDIIGRADMTYLTSEFAENLLVHRKEDTDRCLDFYISDVGLINRTSVDMTHRILRVVDRDITTQEIEENKVRIDNGSSFIDFNVLELSLVGLNTDVILKKSTPQVTEPAIFQPDGVEPVMQYTRVLKILSSEIAVVSDVVTITFSEPLLVDVFSSWPLRLESTGSPEIYTNVSPVSGYGITNINYSSEYVVSFDIQSTVPAFFAGEITMFFQVEVPLYTAETPNPTFVCNELFGEDQTYTYLAPAIDTPFVYQVWVEPTLWPEVLGTGTKYEKLKQLYSIIQSGQATDDLNAIVTNNLFLNPATFAKMMEIFLACENYIASMYTFERPTQEQLYALTSIFRTSAKVHLRDPWVKEEIKYDPLGGTAYEKLMLNGQFFWKALHEPVVGPWDPSLQTIPADMVDISPTNVPIIDPELLAFKDMLQHPGAKIYRELYKDRVEILRDKFDEYFAMVTSGTYNPDAFEEILNEINTGSTGTSYDLLPEYDDLQELIADFESTDDFRIHKATLKLEEAFGFSAEAFSVILPIMRAYEDNNPIALPSHTELKKVVKLLVTGFKKIQLYPTLTTDGWIEEEVEGTFDDGVPVKYYNVLKMRLSPELGILSNRINWQYTLRVWNRIPTIVPDIVPPENIKEFIAGETAHDIWVARKTAVDTLRDDIATLFNSAVTPVGDLLANYEELLSMAVARTEDDTITVANYIDYFLDLENLEELGEDIRPYIAQLGIEITEYRVLRKIYTVINDAQGSPSVDLLESEYTDVIDILIKIHTRNVLPFEAIQEEFDEDVILCSDAFQNYKPTSINFPLNTVVNEPNKWRTSHRETKAWKDTLETRDEREKRVKEAWKDVLLEAEDITMPVMRDALIKALKDECESMEDAAERLAKTLFIETKDNCCVKHSRVSFAIETLQGFYFSLQSGIFNDYLDGFKITAPNFKREWQWLGSYATWRAAIFTYIFPENLLYPTLKRLQSPAFRQLSETLRNANRFSPDDACRAAKNYQAYFEDLQQLEIVCSVNSGAYLYNQDPFDCCGDSSDTISPYCTFFIGQSPTSGKSYWSQKIFYDQASGAHSFWEELPLIKDVKILGCYPLAREYDEDHQALDLALWLFYTYRKDGKLVLAYIKKDLMTAGSQWEDEAEVEMPNIWNAPFAPISVSATQSSLSWDSPSFLFTIGPFDTDFYDNVNLSFDINSGKFNTSASRRIHFISKNKKPISSVKFRVEGSGANTGVWFAGVLVAFQNEIRAQYFGSTSAVPTMGEKLENIPIDFSEILGCFQRQSVENKIIIIGKEAITGEVKIVEATFSYQSGVYASIPIEDLITYQIIDNNSSIISNAAKILPTFKVSTWEGALVVKSAISGEYTGAHVKVQSDEILLLSPIRLKPQYETLIPIESSDCYDNVQLRKDSIRANMVTNMNQPVGTMGNEILSTATLKEYFYEAYYFVPMLIALDQQSRGQYEAALSWYRSVYDYTLSDNTDPEMRKVFYGLVLEGSINSTYQRPADWLLDPLNPHMIAQTRINAYTKYTIQNITQCLLSYGDREFTIDTIETVPNARKLYSEALSLLKVPELDRKPSLCITMVNDCLDDIIVVPAPWENSFSVLKTKLLNLGNTVVIQDMISEIASIFNADGATIEEKFSNAFAYIETNAPAPPTPDTVVDIADGHAEQMNNAFRYLFADISLTNFNSQVGQHFKEVVASISFVEPELVETEEMEEHIAWLGEEVLDNATPYSFTPVKSSGAQRLPNEYAYNPFSSGGPGFTANLVYSNAAVVYDPFLYAESYTPLITYRFCLPKNPVYTSMELKANLELFKIHNCRNIAGMVRELDIFAAATDSTTGVPMIGAGGSLILPGIGNFTPSQYRFRVLIERAKQLVAQAQQLESQFLSALEKEDAESYSQLRARQDLQTAKATVKLQDLRVRQSENERTVADIQHTKATFIKGTYDSWIDVGLNGYETASLTLLTVSTVIETTLAAVALTPAGKFDINDALSATARASYSVSQIMSQLASYQRRAEEWQFQSNIASFDIALADQQIKIADQNIRIVSQEREIASLNMDNATDTLEFLKSKFTNAELYRWMGNVLERTYSYMLSLSTAVARSAERQYYFEQQQQAGPFILDDYWEIPEAGTPNGGGTDRRGLTGSARLLQDLTRLDQFAFENTKRKLQMTKRVSLAQNFPEEFQEFRETGVLGFAITDRMFDYDFPGHYLRLINGVKASIVGLVPVNDGIKATLTAGATSYTVIEANGLYQRVPIRRMEIDQIALTAPTQSNGLFELQPMQGELLNPFEGMGVESQWEFKMPKFSNRMDYNQIADVLIDVEYTAMESFQYRYQVLQDIDNTAHFARGFSFKNDFPDQWYELAEAQEGTETIIVEFELKRDNFPQGLNEIKLDGSNLLLHFVREGGFTDEIEVFDFNLASAEDSQFVGETVDGTFHANELTNILSNQGGGTPFVKLRLSFDNNFFNRELFSEEKVQDIVLLVNCRADLPAYPL